MKLFEYIVNYSFFFGFSLVIILYFGPTLIKRSIHPVKEEIQQGYMTSFKLDYIYKNVRDYVRLICSINNDSINETFHHTDKDYYNLQKFLCENKLILFSEPPCIISNYNLPIFINRKELDDLRYTRYAINEKNNLTFLEINETLIIGKGLGLFIRSIQFILGLIFAVFGVFSFSGITIQLVGNFKEYAKTGSFPKLPNMITEGIKGWRSVFSNKPKS